jgi:hypothetical protein
MVWDLGLQAGCAKASRPEGWSIFSGQARGMLSLSMRQLFWRRRKHHSLRIPEKENSVSGRIDGNRKNAGTAGACKEEAKEDPAFFAGESACRAKGRDTGNQKGGKTRKAAPA